MLNLYFKIFYAAVLLLLTCSSKLHCESTDLENAIEWAKETYPEKANLPDAKLLKLTLKWAEKNDPEAAKQLKAEIQKNDLSNRYFPAYMELDLWEKSYLAEQLENLEEKEISKHFKKRNKAVYRFTWIRAFECPFVFRLTLHKNGNASFRVKSTLGNPDSNGPIFIDDYQRFKKKDPRLVTFLKVIEASNLTLYKSSLGENEEGLDGAQWLFESIISDNHEPTRQLLQGWSPENGVLRDLGMAFIQLAGIEFDKETVY